MGEPTPIKAVPCRLSQFNIPNVGTRSKLVIDEQFRRKLNTEIYKHRLGAIDTERMLTKDGDGGKKLEGRAQSYDPLTLAYLEILQRLGCVVFSDAPRPQH